MSEKTVMVTKQAEVLTVTLHRPEALNALNDEMTEELCQVLEAAAADASATAREPKACTAAWV